MIVVLGQVLDREKFLPCIWTQRSAILDTKPCPQYENTHGALLVDFASGRPVGER